MSTIIGIDLGTTNSLSAVFRDGQPVLMPNALGSVLTPSVVGVLTDGSVVVGETARELRVTQPQNCASCFKRLMGSDTTVTLADRQFTAPELSSLVLRSLKEDAERFLGETVTDAVITTPAYFNEQQRKATQIAAGLAGLKVRRMVNEPTAAALTYGFHDAQADKRLLVIDLGGGTFDVTLMEVFEGTLEILSTAGESVLGGEDFTNRLVALVLRQQNQQLELAELKEPLRVARLREECERAKRTLASEEEAFIRWPDEQGFLAEGAKKFTVDRAAFATAVAPLIERLKSPIAKALRDGRCEPERVDEVILVGGATRMPVVRDFVAEFFSQPPHSRFNPDEVVALGAAVQAALIADDRAVREMVMTDVCPHTLGVDSSKELGREIRSGYFVPIIHRNTTIPVSKEELFSTMFPNQTEVSIDIYQGENRRVENNLKIGELKVKIPPGPKGTAIYIRFTYDINGLLEVEAYAAGMQGKARTVLNRQAGDLSEAELAAALEKMQALKYYPREDQQVQRLLRKAERLVGEVSPYQRSDLEEAIDSLERAIAMGERELVESAQGYLEQMLSLFDGSDS